jgi:trk system potassium uptake protein TrkH
MPDLRPILHIIGLLLIGLAILMLIPAAADLASGDPDWLVFWASAATTGFFGMAMVLANRRPDLALNIKQAFVLTTLAWVLMAAFAALPFKFAKGGLSYAGSFFEAVSQRRAARFSSVSIRWRRESCCGAGFCNWSAALESL